MVVCQVKAFLEVIMFNLGQGFSPFFLARGLEGRVVVGLLIVLRFESGIFLGSEIMLGVSRTNWSVRSFIAVF